MVFLILPSLRNKIAAYSLSVLSCPVVRAKSGIEWASFSRSRHGSRSRFDRAENAWGLSAVNVISKYKIDYSDEGLANQLLTVILKKHHQFVLL